jgi:hypothetical protein
MVWIYRNRYPDLKYPNNPAIPAQLFRHKISQWSGYPGTAIQAYNNSMVRLSWPAIWTKNMSMLRLYRHRYSGTKCLIGLSITAPLRRHKISKWSRLSRHRYRDTKYLNGPSSTAPLQSQNMIVPVIFVTGTAKILNFSVRIPEYEQLVE